LQKREIVLGSSLFFYSFIKEMALKDKVKFTHEFFGYDLSNTKRRYARTGLLGRLGGTKLSDNSFFVPKRNTSIIKAYLDSRGVNFVVKE
jgi:hypothetical protein